MDRDARTRLQAAGWSVGDAKDFLDLTQADADFIEMKLALARDLKQRRRDRRLNQTQVARLVGSSQSRVAKMESADPSVSIDLLIKTLLKLGARRVDVGEIVSSPFAGAS